MMGLLRRRQEPDEPSLGEQLQAFAEAIEARAQEAREKHLEQRRRLDRLNDGGPESDVP